MKALEIFKNIATVVGCISACIALLITIVKPLRQRLIDSIMSKAQSQEMKEDLKSMSDKIDLVLKDNGDMKYRIETIERHIIENESDRLKNELSVYYNRCCRGLQIFPEEMLRVEEVYDRYHNQLGLNHIGTNMYNAIEKYYEQQDFIKMKKG